jgi:hypothetical protein
VFDALTAFGNAIAEIARIRSITIAGNRTGFE